MTSIVSLAFWCGHQGTVEALLPPRLSLDLALCDSVGGSQEGSADCEYENAPPLILSETSPNTVRYTYRVTWNVSGDLH